MSGDNLPPEESQQPESIADRLRSHGVFLGMNPIQTDADHPARLQAEYTPEIHLIESVVAGYDAPSAYGPTFMVERDYPLNYLHGEVALNGEVDWSFLAEWCRCRPPAEMGMGRVLFLDTETTGLSGGTGTYVFMVGLGYYTEIGFKTMQLFMRHPSQEAALAAVLDRILMAFDTLVTFNGKAFDIPILTSRHVINGIDNPFTHMDHIDLLPLARRLWKNRLPSRRLADLETDILSLYRTGEDIPGSMIPYIYFNYLRDQDARPLASVFYHNEVDILSMAALFNRVAVMLSNPYQNEQIHGIDMAEIARMYEELKHLDTAIQLYEICLRKDLPLPFFLQTLQRFSMLYRKQGNWEQAVSLWKKTLDYRSGDGKISFDSCIELAKYYEHHQRDASEALRWAKTAMQELERISLPRYQKRSLQAELDRRLSRLGKRLG